MNFTRHLSRLLLIALLSGSAFAGTVIGQYQTATGGLVNNATLTFSLSQAAIAPGQAGVVAQYTSCYTDSAGHVVGVPDVIVPPTVATNTVTGTLPAGTYYVKISYLQSGSGEGAASSERKVLLTAQGSLIISAPVQIANASGYAVYIGTASGAETLQGTAATGVNYTQSVPLVAGSSPLTINASTCQLRFSDELIPTGTYYTVQMLNAKGTRIAGFPQSWCLYGGSGGTVDISRGVPVGTCSTNGVYYPTPILATPLAGAGSMQTINGGLTLLNDLDVLGSQTVAGDQSVTGALTVGGAQTVSGAQTVAGNQTVSGTLTVTGGTYLAGGIASYKGVSTVANGIPQIVAKADQTVLGANVSATTLYAVPVAGAGFYRVSCYVVETTAATSSSTLPACSVTFTDNDSSAAITIATTSTSTGNTVGTVGSGQTIVNAKASTNIQFSTASYATSGAASMVFAIHLKLEYLGN